jgi:argininosuccinate lyase
MPFRDAYKSIGRQIEQGQFTHSPGITHTHEGSIGNLQNDQLNRLMEQVIGRFNFSKVHRALEQLLR